MSFFQYKRPGFTLIEVALVLALMGIIYAMALPRMNGNVLVQKRAEISSKQIASSLKLARSMAIATQETHVFYLNTGTGQFGIYAGSIAPENLVEKMYSLETGVSVSGQTTVAFSPSGAATTSGGSSMTCSAGTASWTIDVLLATGMVIHQKDD